MSFAFSFLQSPERANSANLLIEQSQVADDKAAISGLAGLAAIDNANDGANEARIERAAVVQFDGGLALDDAEEVAGIKPWTAAEIKRHARRRSRAQALGLALDRAEIGAARLVQRDRDTDDRTLCIECRHARPNTCAVRDAYLPDVLQRCPRFSKGVEDETD